MIKSKRSNILYSVAIDPTGEMVLAYEAKKDLEYRCHQCESPLILRKSGKVGKNSKRPHFAHKTLTPNCTPETALHYSFKNLLFNKIIACLKSQIGINFNWDCQYCTDNHKGNLLKKIREVKLEYNLGACRPDIALLDVEGNVFGVIEIVVTHKPEPKVLNYYKENNIILIQIDLKDDRDVLLIDKKLEHPDYVDLCFNPRCKKCNNYLQVKQMIIIEGSCWKCNRPMKIAAIQSKNGGAIRNISNNLKPSNFTRDEIQFARSKGVLLNNNYSKTVNKKYLSNTCSNCNSFAGDHFLFTQYIAPANYGDLKSKKFNIGYHCEECG